MQYQLRISGYHYEKLRSHLFPGDNKEAVAVALCGRHERNDLSILLVHKVELIPYHECERHEDFIRWKTDRVVPILEAAEKKNFAILKIHCHPGGYRQFSAIDDQSDQELFSSVFGWCDGDSVHGSAVMLPDGEIFGRVFTPTLNVFALDKVSVASGQILIWDNNRLDWKDHFSQRNTQVFGEATYSKLKNLKVAVVGVSGTGSPTIEQLVRLGVGRIVIVDPDKIENKNLNRILNSKTRDAKDKRYKTDVAKNAIDGFELGTQVTAYNVNLFDSRDALLDLVTCDIVFGCVDSVDGRHLLNQLCNFYLIPYTDIGVRLDADGNGGIDNICASVNYIQPGFSSLLSRGVYTTKRLFDDGLLRQDPKEFSRREKHGYVHNANVERPAVISINMLISSIAVTDFLNRLHTFRDEPQGNFARITVDCIWNCIENTPEDQFKADTSNQIWMGRGDHTPFLRLPELEAAWK